MGPIFAIQTNYGAHDRDWREARGRQVNCELCKEWMGPIAAIATKPLLILSERHQPPAGSASSEPWAPSVVAIR